MAQATFLRYSYGQGYRYPTIAEKYIFTNAGGITIYPNPEVKPETSWNTEVGLKQGFKIGMFQGFADIAVFGRNIKIQLNTSMLFGDLIRLDLNSSIQETHGLEELIFLLWVKGKLETIGLFPF